MYLKFGANWFHVDLSLSICVTLAKCACVSRIDAAILSPVLFQYGFVIYEVVYK